MTYEEIEKFIDDVVDSPEFDKVSRDFFNSLIEEDKEMNSIADK